MNEELLKEWEELFNKKLTSEIKFHLVSSEDTEVEVIFNILYEEIPENVNYVYLDITHAFRHFPMVAAFSIPVLKYIKKFKNFQLIYGKLVSNDVSPIIFMNTPTRLIELLEAVSLAENSGNFEKFSSILNNEEIKSIYLKIETNRKISKSFLNNVKSKLPRDNTIKKVATEFITKEVFEKIKDDRLPLRMAKRALFFADRNQFLKAYTLIYEAFINTQPELNVNGTSYEKYEKRKKRLEEKLNPRQKKIYHTIRLIRNAIVHGIDPEQGKIREIISNEKELHKWVYKGYEIVKELL